MKVRTHLIGLMILAIAGLALAACSESIPPGMDVDLENIGNIENITLDGSVPDVTEFTGIVEAISDGSWTVSGMTFLTLPETVIETGIVVGSNVEVYAIANPDSTYTAISIELVDDVDDVDDGDADDGDVDDVDDGDVDDADEVEFTGIVESISAESWVVSGMTFLITVDTEIDAEAVVGSAVSVEALLNADGSMVALDIELTDDADDGDVDDVDDGDVDDVNEVKFTGIVESISAESWVVSGMTFLITADTEIDEGAVVGSTVNVEALLNTDGTMIALEIELDDDDEGADDTTGDEDDGSEDDGDEGGEEDEGETDD